jgi:multicomponent Na+:H+ antiporter subunit G
VIEIVKFLIGLCIALGAFLTIVTAVGLIRLPDVYTRTHAASKAATLGVMFVLLGTFLYFYLLEGHMNSRLILGIIFIFITSPVAGHLICRAAYHTNEKLWEGSVQDDLASVKKERSNQ